MIRIRFAAWLLFSALAVCARPAWALKWGEFHAERDDRFYQEATPARAFLGEGMDWSGIGTWQNGWATMISDLYFLTSSHIRWSPGQADPLPAQFYRTNVIDNTNAANSVALNIDTNFGVQIANTDLFVGRLTQPVPGWVRKYPLIKRNDQANWLSYQDTSVWIYGRSGDASIDPAYAKARIGRNRVYSAFSQATISGMVGTVLKWNSKPDAGSFGIDEVSTISGDSSGPTFVSSPSVGGLAFAGLHSSWDTDTSIAAYLTQIDSVVPEPISIATDQFGDFNGDFKVNSADYIILAGNYNGGSQFIYNRGDLNGDGFVNDRDFSLLAGVFGADVLAPSDFNKDGSVDSADLKVIGNNWLLSPGGRSQGDANRDGKVDQSDIAVLNANWRFDISRPRPIPVPAAAGDANGDGFADDVDLGTFAAHYGLDCSLCASDYNHDGHVDGTDFGIFAASYYRFRPGDVNLDSVVNNADISILLSNWGRTSVGWAGGDINSDNIVDANDFALMADWWGWNMPSNGGQPSIILSGVPEPTALALLLTAALLTAIASPRHRRQA